MRLVVALGVIAAGGCALVTSLDDLGASDAALDAPNEAGSDASDAAVIVYNALDAAAAWSTFDMKSIGAGNVFSGGAFDGRHVYFAPSGTVVVRYDVQAPFATSTSWETFAITSVDTLAGGFSGAVFDGRYVYFVPYSNGSFTGRLARYDTQGAFGATASWLVLDLAAANGNWKGFSGATFDGQYVTFVPHSRSVVLRYDTKSALDAGTAYSMFDLQSINNTGAARGFVGGVFDGHYVYLVPNFNSSASAPSDLVARYDTQGAFDVASSWTTFATKSANPAASGYFGAAFDGKRVYLAPSPGAVVASYDTQAVFGAPGSWTTLDMASIAQTATDFRGATFDGKYVYFSPSAQTVARYDTEGSFGLTSSWSTTSIASPDGGAGSYAGAIFDGRYVYFVPAAGIAARFDAKQPASMPSLPGWNGSFY